jgi:hypothetical protein
LEFVITRMDASSKIQVNISSDKWIDSVLDVKRMLKN